MDRHEMISATASRNDRAIFWSLLVLALALRLWGIWHVSATDEYNEVIEALRVCSGHLNFERWGKRFYLYVLAGEYGAYFSAGWLLGIFANPMDFAGKVVRNMEPLFIMGRITSALAGAASVGVLYRIGERFFSRGTAVIASLLLTLTVFHIDLSQQAKVDATLGLLVLLAIYFMLNLLQDTGAVKRDLLWSGLFTGLAIQTKISAAALFVPFGVAVLFLFRSGRRRDVQRVVTNFAPAFLAGFILGNPPVALAPLQYLQDMSGMGKVYTTAINEARHDHLGFIAYPLYFHRTMGAVASVLAAAALAVSLLRPDRRKILLLSFFFAFYLLLGASRYMVADYYMIPAVPVLYLFIGDLFGAGGLPGWRLAGGARAGRILMIMMVLLALAAPIARVAEHELALAEPNTRYRAKEWIEANIPSDSKILMDSGKSINSFAPPIAENKASLVRVLARAENNVARGRIVNNIVDANGLIYYRLLLGTVPEKSYDITSTMFGLEVENIDYYLVNGFDYLIISKHMKEARTTSFFAERYPDEAAFYRSLDHDERIELVKVIGPTKTSSGGTYYIYRLQNGPHGAGV